MCVCGAAGAVLNACSAWERTRPAGLLVDILGQSDGRDRLPSWTLLAER